MVALANSAWKLVSKVISYDFVGGKSVVILLTSLTLLSNLRVMDKISGKVLRDSKGDVSGEESKSSLVRFNF